MSFVLGFNPRVDLFLACFFACFKTIFVGFNQSDFQATLETDIVARTLTNVKMELTTVIHTLIAKITLDPLIVSVTLVGRVMVSDAQVTSDYKFTTSVRGSKISSKCVHDNISYREAVSLKGNLRQRTPPNLRLIQ